MAKVELMVAQGEKVGGSPKSIGILLLGPCVAMNKKCVLMWDFLVAVL